MEGDTTTIGGVDGPKFVGYPAGIAVAKDGTVFVSTYGNSNAVCIISPDGTITTLAGGEEPGFADGRGEAARFSNPTGMAMGPDGRLYVADACNDSIRCVDRNGNVSTVAGRPTEEGAERESIDGDLTVARFNSPYAVAVASDGTIYVGEEDGERVRQIREGVVSTVCQCGTVRQSRLAAVASTRAACRRR